MQAELRVHTPGQGLHEITSQVAEFVQRTGVRQGLLTLFVQHTSCSILVQENADPNVRRDLEAFFHRLVPPADHPSMDWVRHDDEGPDDMPAHIKAALTAVSLAIPIRDGRVALGQWQGIYLFEHRHRPHDRRIVAHIGP